jgi:hypothetical protein
VTRRLAGGILAAAAGALILAPVATAATPAHTVVTHQQPPGWGAPPPGWHGDPGWGWRPGWHDPHSPFPNDPWQCDRHGYFHFGPNDHWGRPDPRCHAW